IMLNLNSFFAPNVKQQGVKSAQLDFYKPTYEKGKGGVYQSVIRFVSWYKDSDNSCISKWSCWLEDPATGSKRKVDCPSSIDKKSVLQDTYWMLYNSKSAIQKDLASKFSRSQKYYALVQIIKDDNNPDLNGKIMIWEFGRKIYDKINAEKKPMIGKGIEPFDVFNGRAFGLHICKVGEYTNYDSSTFLGKEGECPLCWDVEYGQGKYTPISFKEEAPKTVIDYLNEKYSANTYITTVINDMFNKVGQPTNLDLLDDMTKQQLAAIAFFAENSPNLDSCKFKEWDEETTNYVYDVIAAVTGKQLPHAKEAVVNHNTWQQPNVQPQGQTWQQPNVQPNVQPQGGLDTSLQGLHVTSVSNEPVVGQGISMSDVDISSLLAGLE
ncbi:MAG: hypothetical protein ACRCTZ_20465, partial [Sarcina sp.]